MVGSFEFKNFSIKFRFSPESLPLRILYIWQNPLTFSPVKFMRSVALENHGFLISSF